MAPRAEQLPAQLAPRPQVAFSNVSFWWQQLTVTESLRKVKALSKKSIEAAFVFPEVNYERKTIKVPKPGGVLVGTRLVLDDVSPDGHEAISIVVCPPRRRRPGGARGSSDVPVKFVLMIYFDGYV